jgi:hypothetical protein
MPLQVDDLRLLEEYLGGVLDRSEHHAKTVGAIALALVGAVLWRKDDVPLEVKTYAGKTANILWVHIGGRRYALAYNHQAETIELRDRTQSGDVIASFTNSTPVSEVRRVFKAL